VSGARPTPTPTRLRPRLPTLVVRLGISVVIPVVAYLVLRPRVGSDTVALAVAGLVPAGFTLARFARRRRVDPIGVLALAGFGIALLVAAAWGGNPLLLKIRDAPLIGAIGTILVLSAAVRRPVLPPLLRLLGRDRDATSGSLTLATVIVGTTLVVDAVTRVVLADTLQTSTFLAVDHEASWSILGAGLAVLWLSHRRA
jgi:hypothetical protein